MRYLGHLQCEENFEGLPPPHKKKKKTENEKQVLQLCLGSWTF